MTGSENADDLRFLANTPTQAESLLHVLEQETGVIGLYVNANKTEYKNKTYPLRVVNFWN